MANVKSSLSGLRVHPETKEALRILRKIYGNGHKSRPSDSVPQTFIPNL